MKLDPAVQQLIGLNLAGVPARVVHHLGARRGESEHCLRCSTREAVLSPTLRMGGSAWVPQWCETDTSSKNSFPPATSCSRMIPRPAA